MKKILLLLIIQFSIFNIQSAWSQLGEWTWLHGSNFPNNAGNYGTIGIPSPTNVPTAVYEPFEWTDASGTFWLFGGRYNNGDFMNTLWKYDRVSNEWTWVHGLSTPND